VPKSHTVSEYLQQAAHNCDFAAYIRKNKSDCLDWSATSLFYAAVHYVNAYFKHYKIPIPRRHSSPDPKQPGRSNIVQQDPTLSAIYDPYRNLDDESRDARYELKKVSEALYDKYLLSEFEKIRRFIVPKVTS
jgi:hypothetical protein